MLHLAITLAGALALLVAAFYTLAFLFLGVLWAYTNIWYWWTVTLKAKGMR